MTAIVLTFMGEDRPGIVDKLSETIAAREASWLESRTARLGGYFTGILRLEVADDKSDELIAAIKYLANEGIETTIKTGIVAEQPLYRTYTMTVLGQDRVGIVSKLSHLMAKAGVNIEELTSQLLAAPMSGETLFRAQARIGIPADLEVEALCRQLEVASDELMVEIRLSDSE